MDGSCLVLLFFFFSRLSGEAQNDLKNSFELKKPIRVDEGDKLASLEPHQAFRLSSH